MFHGAKLAFKYVYIVLNPSTVLKAYSRDYKTWLLLGAIYGCTASGAVTTFFPM
jgi:hypothetical protein